MKKTIKYLQDGEYHYATVKDVGDLEQLKTKHKEDLVTALNEIFTTGGNAKPTGYDDLVKKVNNTQTTVNGINNTITDINGKVVANDEAIAQAKKDLQDALTQFQTFNDEIEQAKKDAETKLANAKQALKDEFNANLADAQKANQKQLEDKVAVIQGNLDTTSNTLNDVKTQLANAKLDYGNVNVSIQKLNDMLSTKLSSTDLDPLRTSIQNQETEIQQTKDSIATKAGKAELDVLSGRVSNTEAKIKQQADEISLGVKKSELNGAIDNYQIEGTNRLRNTIDFDIDGGYWKLDRYSINSNTDVHPYDQAHDVSALVLQKTGSAKQDVDFTNEDLGQSFVVSMWNKKDAQPQVWYGNTQLTNRQVAEIKGDYERSFFTFIPTNINVKTIMFKYDAGTVDQLVIGEPKLELGTKPKAYAPNPNDEHKQIVNTKAELQIASDKIESTVEKQTKTDNNVNQLSSRVTQTEQGITAANDLITKTKDGLIKDYTGKINASAKSLSSEFDEKTNEKIGQITDSGENLILNSAFTNETDRKDKWQNISDKVNIIADNNGLMWAHMSQTGLTADNPISLTSNYFPIKQGKITVGVDIKSDNTSGLSGAKILVLQTYNANKQRVDFTELTLENMGLTVQQLADGQSHRGVYRLGNDRSDAVYMTVKAVLPRNGSIYFTNFSAKLSSIDNGGYTPNAEDLKRQILNQKTKIEQNSQQITLKASSTELRDVRTIANGAVSSATNANNKISAIQSNGGGRNLLVGTGTASGDVVPGNGALINDGFNGYAAIKTNTAWSEYCINLKSALGRTNAKTGDWFTISVYVKADKQINDGSLGVYRALGSVDADTNDGFLNGISMQDKPITTQWQQYAWSFQINDISLQRQNTRVEYSQDTGDNWIYWAGWMVEKGTIAHEWQPAPEDIQTQIDQARTDIQSTLTVANNGITAATNLKTTYDNYVQKNDANIKLLGDRITNEVSKITSNGGGRNYLRDSDKSISGWSQDLGTMPNEVLNSLAGETITVSVDTEWSDYQHDDQEQNRLGFELAVSGSDGKSYWFGAWKGPTTPSGKERVSTTFTLPANVTFTVNNNGHNGYVGINGTGKVSHAKIEKGTIAHDWQPAPEDTQSQIESVSSKIDQTATSITSTVNSTKQDLQGQINSANTKITQTANSITEQLKSYSKTGDIQNYVNTTVQKTADGINTKVSGVESKVNGLNTSDRNLARGTSDSWADYVFVTDGGNNRTISLSKVYIDGLKAGDVLTCGITIKNTGITAGTMRVQGSGNATGWNDGSYYSPNYDIASAIPSGTTKELVYTITLTANMIKNSFWDVNIRTDNVPKGGTLSYKCFFVKKGNIPTGWSPAPEDVDSAIATTKTDLVQQITDAKNAAIKVSKDSINSEVSDVRTTITQVNNKVSGVESKVDNANSKINDITSNGGGRNLLIISSFVGDSKTFAPTFDAHWKCGNNTTWTFSSDKPVSSNDQSLQFTPKSSLPNTGNGIWYIAPQVKAGEVYTFSFWGKSTSDGFKMEVESFSDISKFTMTTAWKYYSGQLKFASDNRNMYFRISDDNSVNVGTVTIFHPMLEKGVVAHDWQPAPEDVITDINNVNTKVEQYKTGINQTATGVNLFAQVITGNKSIDVTKSNIGIDPNQIKIASNRIVIDGDTSINGILNVPNVVLKGKNGSIDLSGDAINIKNSNSTYGLTLASDGVAVGDKDRFYGLFTSSGIDLFTKSQDAPRPFSIGAIENDWLTTNHDIHGISVIGKPYKDNKDNNFQGGNFISFGFQDPETTNNNPMISLFWRDFNVTNDDKEEKGIHMYDDIYINHDIHLYKSPICVRTLGTQDPLMITGLKFGNSTQSDYFQPTLMAGWSNDIKGDSGLTFFWNSVRAFGTLDLTGTQIRMADAEANLEFGWVSWTDWPGKIPALFRRNGNNSGGIAVGGDCNVILFGNGHRWNLNQRNGY